MTKQLKGLDRKYLAWIRKQPSALSGGFPVEACHYRTAKNSGTGCKPLFSAVPLTPQEHRLQHRIGQFAFQPREWWVEQTAKYLAQWQIETGIRI